MTIPGTTTARSTATVGLLLLLAGLSLLPAAPAGAQPALQQVLVFTGRGHGHGVGLAQDSANAMAGAGNSVEQILGHFYPGTGRGRAGGSVRVDVWEGGSATAVDVSLPQGGQVSGSSGSAAVRPGGSLHITVDAAGYHVRQSSSGTRGAALRSGLLLPLGSASPSPSHSLLPIPVPSSAPSQPPPPPPPPGPHPTGSAKPTRVPGASPSGSATPSTARPRHASPTPTASSAGSLDSSTPVTVTPAGGGVTAVGPTGRSYRGTVTALSRSGFRLVNTLDVEQYLGGLGEIPSSWPAAALQAQAVAARTYALRAVGSNAPLGYDLCDDDRCQVYLGAQRETASSVQAASSTRGEVVTYRGALADTFYSANAGGVTASTTEGFATASAVPYLPSGVAAAGPVAPWTQSLDPAAVAARLGYPGRLTGITVTGKGPSGRVTSVRLDGSAGSRPMTGIGLASSLGLWSTLFTVSGQKGVAQALPPPALGLTQFAPEQAAVAPPLLAGVAGATPTDSPSAAPPSGMRVVRNRALSPLAGLELGVAGLVGSLALALAVRGQRSRRRAEPGGGEWPTVGP